MKTEEVVMEEEEEEELVNGKWTVLI